MKCGVCASKSINTFATFPLSFWHIQQATRICVQCYRFHFCNFPCLFVSSLSFLSCALVVKPIKKVTDGIDFDWGQRWLFDTWWKNRTWLSRKRRQVAYCSMNGYPRESWHLKMNPSILLVLYPPKWREFCFGLVFSWKERSVIANCRDEKSLVEKIRTWLVGGKDQKDMFSTLNISHEKQLLIIIFSNK